MPSITSKQSEMLKENIKIQEKKIDELEAELKAEREILKDFKILNEKILAKESKKEKAKEKKETKMKTSEIDTESHEEEIFHDVVDRELSINPQNPVKQASKPREEGKIKRPTPASWLFREEKREYIIYEYFSGCNGYGKEVAKKAKELWDGMSVEDQEPWVSKNKSMWEEYYRVNGGGKGKSTRKKNISIPTVEAVEFTEDEEEELEVVLWDYNKKTYLLDEKTGNIYDYETQDIIGTKQGEIVIMINDSK
jgi:hypothetical protein